MKIKQAEFITSVASANNFLKVNKPIIAVAGKSNVGKSSLINMLANQKKLAKTSDTPGRTRLVNYFDFGEFILADLPGYGFAKVSKVPSPMLVMTDTGTNLPRTGLPCSSSPEYSLIKYLK